MRAKVYIDGVVLDSDDAQVSVFDRGFLYGDSVYEVLRTSGGRPVDLDLHLERLERSARAIALAVPNRDRLRTAIRATLQSAGRGEAYVRIILTRGAGDIGLDPALAERESVIVIVRPLALPPAEFYVKGVALAIVHVERTPRAAMDPAVKSGNYLNNILALRAAKKEHAYEALMCDHAGHIAEGSSSNFFFVAHDVLTTPSIDTGLLDGITRRRVLEFARALGLDVVERKVLRDEVREAEEAFITSSIRGVLPVAAIDGRPLPASPGPRTLQLTSAYADHLTKERG